MNEDKKVDHVDDEACECCVDCCTIVDDKDEDVRDMSIKK